MVPRQAIQPFLTQQVRARVADVDDLQMAAQIAGRSQRRAHSEDVGIAAAVLDEHCVEVLKAAAGVPRRVRGNGFIQPEDPIGPLEGELHQTCDCHPAGQLPASMAAHPVGDDQPVARLVRAFRERTGRQAGQDRLDVASDPGDEEVIFVARSDVTRMGESADIDVDGR